MQYIAYAQRGEYRESAQKESFDCVMLRNAVPPDARPESPIRQVALLARRLTGKYIAPECKHSGGTGGRDSPKASAKQPIRADHGHPDLTQMNP